jgi:hypothetical protein
MSPSCAAFYIIHGATIIDWRLGNGKHIVELCPGVFLLNAKTKRGVVWRVCHDKCHLLRIVSEKLYILTTNPPQATPWPGQR